MMKLNFVCTLLIILSIHNSYESNEESSSKILEIYQQNYNITAPSRGSRNCHSKNQSLSSYEFRGLLCEYKQSRMFFRNQLGVIMNQKNNTVKFNSDTLPRDLIFPKRSVRQMPFAYHIQKKITPKQSESMKILVNCTPDKDNIVSNATSMCLDDSDKFSLISGLEPYMLSESIKTTSYPALRTGREYLGLFLEQTLVFALSLLKLFVGISLFLFFVFMTLLVTCGNDLNLQLWKISTGLLYNNGSISQQQQNLSKATMDKGSASGISENLGSIIQRPPSNFNNTTEHFLQGSGKNSASLGNNVQQGDMADAVKIKNINYSNEASSGIEVNPTSVKVSSEIHVSRSCERKTPLIKIKPDIEPFRCHSNIAEKNDNLASTSLFTQDGGLAEDANGVNETAAIGNPSTKIHSYEQCEKNNCTVSFKGLVKESLDTKSNCIQDFKVTKEKSPTKLAYYSITQLNHLENSVIQELIHQFPDLVYPKNPVLLKESRRSLLTTLKEMKDS